VRDGLRACAFCLRGTLLILFPVFYLPFLALACALSPSWWTALLAALGLTTLLTFSLYPLLKGDPHAEGLPRAA
jgi:membrane protein implicated in regulation of membrane protease activity